MKKIIFNVLALAFFSQAFAQNTKVTSIINFTGTVGNYPIEMQLSLQSYTDSVFGEYYYVKSGRDKQIYLKGTLKDGQLILKESAHNVKKGKFENTGQFRLAYVAQTTLNGSWGKKTPNTENSLVVKLTCRENLQAFNPFGFDFNMLKNKANFENMTENEARYYTPISLHINVNKSKRWILGDFDERDLTLDEIELEDVNFDGYLDIKIPIYYPNLAKGDFGYIYFIYNPTKKGFLKNKTLNDLGVLFFDAVKKEAIKYDADGRGNEGTSYYKWQNGKLFITKEERIYEDDPFVH